VTSLESGGVAPLIFNLDTFWK